MKKIIAILAFALLAATGSYAATSNQTDAKITRHPETLTRTSRTINASASVDRRDSTIYVDGTSGAYHVTIPDTDRGRWQGRVLTVKDKAGTAVSHHITVVATNSYIDGSTLLITKANAAVTMQCEYNTANATYYWRIISSYLWP